MVVPDTPTRSASIESIAYAAILGAIFAAMWPAA